MMKALGPLLTTSPFPEGPVVRGVAPPSDRTPMRAVTAAESAEWIENGVVCLRQVIPPEWNEYLKACLDEIFDRDNVQTNGLRTDLTEAAEDLDPDDVLLPEGMTMADATSGGRFLAEIDAWWHEGLRHFELCGPLAQVVAAALSTERLNFYQDHLFNKQGGSALVTGFHQDQPYFCWSGDQIAVSWTSPTPVTKAMGAMRYVKGSHRWAEHQPTLLVSNNATHDSPAQMLPDIEGNPDDYEILTFETEPGDVIIHHANCVHGSWGNTDPTGRVGASIRYIGDDARFVRKESEMTSEALAQWKTQRSAGSAAAVNIAEHVQSIAMAIMQDGQVPADNPVSNYRFPQVWPAPAASKM